jgi:molybdopterin synthase sulfur carrier subunit
VYLFSYLLVYLLSCLRYKCPMPSLRVPNIISYYTEKQTQFEVSGSTALEAVQSAVEKFPALKFHVFDNSGNLRRHIYLFVNDVSVKELNGNETAVGEQDTVRILAAAAGG